MKYDSIIGTGFDRWSKGSYSEGQLKAWSDYRNSYILLSGAYRSGKSELGCRASIRHAYFFPNAKVGIFRKFLASLKKSTLLTLLELIHPSWVADWSNSELVLTLKNGSRISFYGIDQPDKVGSIELTFAFTDEASEVDKNSLGMITGRLSGVLVLPTNFASLPDDKKEFIIRTKDVRQHLMATNPKSEKHHLYEDFYKDKKPKHIAYNSNSISNVNLPETYIINNLAAYVRQGYSEEWVIEKVREIREGLAPASGLHLTDCLTPFGQRNLLGLWVALEGAIYELDETTHYLEKPPTTFGEFQGVYGAVDFGFHNPRIILFKHYIRIKAPEEINPYGTPENVGEKIDSYASFVYWNEPESTYDDMVLAMQKLTREYDVLKWYIPPDQAAVIKTIKRTAGIGINRVRVAKNAVMAGINTVSRFLNLGRFVMLKGQNSDLCWSELTSYSWKQHREGFTLEEPMKVDDHYPDAIRYLLFTRHGKDGV